MIFYLDLINGNDSNNGTTYANRWKSFASGPTAARISPGDTIRIMRTANPTSIGNATWTYGSPYVQLSSSVVKTISNCDTNWSTSSSYVTPTLNNTQYKEGAYSISLVVTSSFTTGLVAYKATGELDLSSYQQVSFWIYSSVAVTTAGRLTLTLCSDVSGATPVNTISIPVITTASGWQVVTVDTGGALGSSIKSVALNSTYDIFTATSTTICLDNIIACKSSSSDDSLTLSSLISKNTTDEPWYCIQSITEDLVLLDNISTTVSWLYPYVGTTETTTTYKREPYMLASGAASTALLALNDAGTDGSPIVFSGGWDMTNMSTQDGDTFISTSNYAGYVLDATRANVTLEKIHCFKGDNGIRNNGGRNFKLLGTTYFGGSITGLNSMGANMYAEKIITTGCRYGVLINGLSTINNIISERCYTTGLNIYGSKNKINQFTLSNNYYGVYFLGAGETTLQNGIIDNSVSSGIYCAGTADMGCSNNVFINTIFNNLLLYNGITYSNLIIYSHKHNRIPQQHWQICDGIIVTSLDGAGRYTDSGLAWRIVATNNTRGVFYPFPFNLCKIACASDETITVTVYVNREDVNSVVKLVCPGKQIAGVDTDVSTTHTGDIDTYSPVSISFTPTETGVVDIYLYIYGYETNYLSGTNSLFDVSIDNITVTRS